MLKKCKTKLNNASIKFYTNIASRQLTKNKKGDTQLVVLVFLLVIVALAIVFFRDTFQEIFESAMEKLGSIFDDLLGSFGG